MKLLVKGPDKRDVVLRLSGTVSIGRADRNDIVIGDPSVSRRHALIHVDKSGAVTLVDLGSVNGSYVNDVRVVLPAVLAGDETVRIGSTTLQLARDTGECAEAAVESQVEGGETTQFAFEKRDVTVLVVDVRGYTRLAERLPVEQLAQLMGPWFRRVSRLVADHDGTIDKFLGDGVMAEWVTPPAEKDDAAPVVDALETALALYRESTTLTSTMAWWPEDNEFRVGIGLNTGPAVFGTFGTESHRDFTVTGDTVNVAFRIQELTKQCGYPIIATEATVWRVRDRFPFVQLAPIELRGKSEALTLYALDPSSMT